MEQWKTIEVNGEQSNYEVSTKGRVRNTKTGRILTEFYNYGYSYVCIKGKNVRVHRLVATAFIPNPHNLPQVDHIDRNKKNNCVENLRWVSRQQNMNNAGKRVYCVELDKIFDTLTKAERETGVPNQRISDCCRGLLKEYKGFHFHYVE